MSALPEEFDMLAAEYALGTLDGADTARAEALEASDPQFSAALAGWRKKFAALDETAPALVPAADLWARIEKGISLRPARTDGLAKQGFSLPALWQSLAFWRNAGLAGALASLVLAVGLGLALMRGPHSPVYVAVLNAPDGRAAAVVNVYADSTVELVPLDAIDVPPDRIIEVWTLQSREQGPVSVGRMDRARKLKLDLKRLSRPEKDHLFELTLEPPGGSPTGKPTGPILMKGLASRSI
jgi:anti-sigma-K factor RskA